MKNIPPGTNAPDEINVIIEIPEGSKIKYEMNKDYGIIVVDRFAFTTMGYPLNYGYIPSTLAADGDPTDVLVLCSQPLMPGVMITCTPVGMLEMEDEAGIDTKIIAVPLPKIDPFYAHITDISDISDAVKNKVKHFFEHYKELEKGKWVKVKDFKDKEDAKKDIQASMKN